MTPKPHIITISPENWCISATDAISTAVKLNINTKGECSQILTGGYSAKQLYQHWAVSKPWNHRKIIYYFGDESCVPPDHQDGNYGMVKRPLFQKGSKKGYKVTRMLGDLSDSEEAARNYEHTLSEAIDIIPMLVGPDGHIASLFPDICALQENSRSVVPVVGLKPPPNRLTITPRAIQSASSTFLFALGKEKLQVLTHALEQLDDITLLPVRLVLGDTWILMHPLNSVMSQKNI